MIIRLLVENRHRVSTLPSASTAVRTAGPSSSGLNRSSSTRRPCGGQSAAGGWWIGGDRVGRARHNGWMTTPARDPYASKLDSGVVDVIGAEVTAGVLVSGDTMRLEDIEARFGVSRTVARDAVKELESLGLLVSRRRSGLTVQPSDAWSVYHPKVVAWRMASNRRGAHLRSFTELRLGLEPTTAELAALRRNETQAARLEHLAGVLDATGRAADHSSFLHADIEFHIVILEATANDLFTALSPAPERG